METEQEKLALYFSNRRIIRTKPINKTSISITSTSNVVTHDTITTNNTNYQILEQIMNCDLFGLHFDVLIIIMKYLTLAEAIELAKTCKSAYRFITSNYVMKHHLEIIKEARVKEKRRENEITMLEIANKYKQNRKSLNYEKNIDDDIFSIFTQIKAIVKQIYEERNIEYLEMRERERLSDLRERMDFRDEYGYWPSF